MSFIGTLPNKCSKPLETNWRNIGKYREKSGNIGRKREKLETGRGNFVFQEVLYKYLAFIYKEIHITI